MESGAQPHRDDPFWDEGLSEATKKKRRIEEERKDQARRRRDRAARQKALQALTCHIRSMEAQRERYETLEMMAEDPLNLKPPEPCSTEEDE